MFKRPLFTVIFLSAIFNLACAQDFPYGNVSGEELDMKSYANDPTAHAVVLQEHGVSAISNVGNGECALFYEYHVKIKIFDGRAFSKGTAEIPVYNNDDYDSYEKLFKLSGITFYRDEKGLTHKIALESTKVYLEKINKHYGVYKFAMPGLQNGCVIEYAYEIRSPYFQNFHSWQFQTDIPKMHSEFEVHIPGFWDYNVTLKGPLKLTETKSDLETGCFTSHAGTCDCSHIVYGMSNIPAFVAEDYMTSPKNFISAIVFELVDYIDPYRGSKTMIAQSWKDIDSHLKYSEYFGSQLKRKGLVKDKVAAIIANKTDELEKANAIYGYWQKWFKWNGYIGIESIDGIGKAIDSHSGSTADINLSLVAALNAAGLNAETVLLSTRDNGVVNNLYPGLRDFNYVIAKVNIGDKSYLLDATDPLLDFGLLPLKCLNDKGRVFSLDKPSYWIDLNLPQREKITYALDLTLTGDGKLKGTITNYSMGYEAYKKRAAIKRFNSVDEYVESVGAKFPRLKILKAEISNPDSLGQPVSENYEVEIDLYDKISGKLAFNPFFLNRINTNPFKLAERSYPVDRGMRFDERYILTMHLPPAYSVEVPPQAISLKMPGDSGAFLTSYESGDNTFTFSDILALNKAIYTAEEYPDLKEFYNKVIQSEKVEIIFKKK